MDSKRAISLSCGGGGTVSAGAGGVPVRTAPVVISSAGRDTLQASGGQHFIKPSLRFRKGGSEGPHMIGRGDIGTLSTNHMRAFRPSFSKAETGFKATRAGKSVE